MDEKGNKVDKVLAGMLEGLVIEVSDLYEDLIDDNAEEALETCKMLTKFAEKYDANFIINNLQKFPSVAKIMRNTLQDLIDTAEGAIEDIETER